MGYQATFKKLREIVTSDNATDAQRTAARSALKKLFRDEITDTLDEMADRGPEYEKLTAQLSAVVDKIKANQFTEAMTEVDKTVSDINNAAAGTTGG